MIKSIRSIITLPRAVTLLTGLLIAGFAPYYVNSLFPIVGWDYKYFLTRLIDTSLHYHVNGLSIQWYTPSFGGGLPAYPHPLNAQFSLPQALALLVNPWTAILASYFAYILVGYLAAYVFLRRSLDLHWAAGTFGAALFSANGFYLEHISNGHLNFQAFPLLPVFLALLLSRRIPVPAAAALIGLASAVVIYSASTYPAVFILLALLICLPLAWLIRPSAFQWRRIFQIALLGGLLALAVNLSKLYAVNSFMRFFPRDMPDRYNIPLQTAPFGLLLQLVGVMGLAPLDALLGVKMLSMRSLLQGYTGAYVGLWELDLSLSPVIWALLVGGAIALFRKTLTGRLAVLPRRKSFWLALGLLLLAVELALEFTFARGWIYPHLRELPFLKALHINPRFGSAFIFPLAMLGAAIFSGWIKNWPEKSIWLAACAANALVLLSLGAYLLIPTAALQQRNFDISGLLLIDGRIKQGESFPIEKVGDVTDQTVFERQTSNLKPYEVLFGYTLKTFQPTVVKGPAREIRDGAFNMTDPTGLVYPEVNGSSPWSRIPQSQRQELEDFLAHRQPDWKIPLGQQIANWLSLAALFACLGLVVYGLGREIRRNKKGEEIK
jgi:hypothetical protein